MKDINNYLKYYIGCYGITKDGAILQLVTASCDRASFWRGGKNTISGIVNDIKLLLRPLQSITDEEINEIWQLVGLNSDFENPAYPEMKKRKYIEDWFKGEGRKLERVEKFAFTELILITNYLRNKEFDCDELIGLELAIDKTKQS